MNVFFCHPRYAAGSGKQGGLCNATLGNITVGIGIYKFVVNLVRFGVKIELETRMNQNSSKQLNLALIHLVFKHSTNILGFNFN